MLIKLIGFVLVLCLIIVGHGCSSDDEQPATDMAVAEASLVDGGMEVDMLVETDAEVVSEDSALAQDAEVVEGDAEAVEPDAEVVLEDASLSD